MDTVPRPFIDNRNNVYVPIPLCCGVTIQVRLGRLLFVEPSLLATVLTTLNDDVTACWRLLPAAVRPLVRRTRIWINGDHYRMGDPRHPQTLQHMTTHHYEGWLDWFVRYRCRCS
jgi:hypothetical protein